MQQTHSYICHLLGVALLVLIVESAAFGQVTNVTNNTSTPIPGAGHDYIKMVSETVNPANGSISLRIGVPVPPGRGVTLPFSFNYDSSGVIFQGGSNPAGAGVWLWDTSYLSSGGWSYPIPTFSSGWRELPIPGQNLPFDCTFVSGFVFRDPGGGRHTLGLAWNDPGQDYNCTQDFITKISAGGDPMYRASMSASNFYPLQVADADGTTYTFAGRVSGSESLVSSIEDRNGNTLNVTDSGGGNFSVTDTLGRQVISSSGFGVSANNYSLSVSGLAPYTVYWGEASGAYSVNSQKLSGIYCAGLLPVSFSQPVITAIQLPTGQEYQFQYDPTYGLLDKIIYPSGGYVRYVWALSSQNSGTLSDDTMFVDSQGFVNGCQYNYDSPAVLARYVSFDGTNEVLQQNFTYTTVWSGGTWSSKTTTVATTVKTVVNGTLTTLGSYNTSYTYTSVPSQQDPYDGWFMAAALQIPVEHTVTYNDWNGNPLRIENKTWVNQYEMQGQEVVDNGTVTSDQFFLYGDGAQMTDKYECGAGQTCYTATRYSLPGAFARHTQTQYHNFGNTPIFPSGPSIFDRPDSVNIYDGSGGHAAEADYTYDPNNPNGNATTKTQKCLYNCTTGDAITHYGYDANGQVTSITDPDGNPPTAYQYMCSDTYVSEIDYPLGQSETFNYDCPSGRLMWAKDRNGQPTYYSYEDLGRLHTVSYPDTGGATYDYGTSVCGTPLTTTINSTYTTSATMDGLCQVIQTAVTSDPQGADKTDTTYDGLGRVFTVSNPYRGGSPPPGTLTTYTYDSLGRTTNVAYPDSTASSTSYAGLSSTIIDAAGKKRALLSDELGHLTQVTEDPDPGGLGYVTNYTYNALDDLTSVTQGSQLPCMSNSTAVSRSFSYDSLSRLSNSCNPESGSLAYTYDPNGNVLTKQDARGTTYFGYDALNRVLYKNYSDPSTVRACYAYDGLSAAWGDGMTNAVGHLTSSWSVQKDGTVVAANETYQFDPMGRPQLGKQCTPGTCGLTYYPLQASYDPMGHELSFSESSVTRASTYDTAARLQSFTANLPGVGNQNLLGVSDYDPAGGIHIATLGSGSGVLTETRTYNNRTWLQSLSVGSVYSLGLTYYGNGNVYTATDSENGNWTYAYDGVNRLQTALVAGHTLSYYPDQYGNMYCSDSGGWPCTPMHGSPLTLHMNFNLGTNRIWDDGDGVYQYDAAGNLTQDGTHGYIYDAENRITCVLGTDGTCTSASAMLYFYDPQGQRVGKQQANSLEDYVYDPQGHIISVHDGSTNPLRTDLYAGSRHVATWNSNGLFWNHADWLGTERVRTNPSGIVAQSCTDTPYGMNLTCTPPDISPMHFTGKQRDWESGLDNFGARYYGGGNSLGRFMTPDMDNDEDDPGPIPYAEFRDPQTLNLYSYVRNNPLTRIDSDGHKLVCKTTTTTQNGIIHVDVVCHEEPDQPPPPPPALSIIAQTRAFLSSDIKDPQDRMAMGFSILRNMVFGGGAESTVKDVMPSVVTIGPSAPVPNVPLKAIKALDAIDATGSAGQNVQGGKTFQNREGKLPPTDGNGNAIQYKEYDVNQGQPGVGRGTERLVTGSDGSAYYTSDHYQTFQKIR